MNYKKLNISLGWLAFLIATIVYFLTAESTASLWDCGEYITAAYKLEVGHPPGAPFFMLVGRVFSLFAGDVSDVAMWINRMSALSSSFSILFLFWSITMLGKKIALKEQNEMTFGQQVIVLGSGFIGAMAYTFTESFWFSAVEGEVYAMSSLFTAVIFWAALKWDEEMTLIRQGVIGAEVRPLRWMVLILFLLGLAIGVHLLGLLVVPAIAYLVMYNLRQGKEVDTKTFLLTGVLGIFTLGFIQEGIIPGTIALASKMEIYFKNSLGLPFMTGAILFFILVIAFLVAGLMFTRKKNWVIANTAMLGLVMLFIGYGSFATIVIRSNANPPLDENNPENLVTLHAYLKREQYGSWPILYGEWYNSKSAPVDEYGDRSPFYDKRYVITTKRGSEVAAFRDKEVAEKYVEESGKSFDIVHKYFETNKESRLNSVPVYAQKTLFPRMYFKGDQNRINGYKNWSGYDPTRKVSRNEIGDDGRPLPTFANNMQFLMSYQVDWMYWRYFMWNFSGRQNDIQGHGDEMRGNWLSGFDLVDEARLGTQGENGPYFTTHNPSHNKFYFIPLILGLIGLFFHFVKAPRDAFVVLLLFLFTGLAIVFYLNQKPYEPRERDYAYAASFYVFAIWIGLGVYGLFESFRSFGKEEFKKLGFIVGGLLAFGFLYDLGNSSNYSTILSIIIISLIGGGAMLVMKLLKKVTQAETPGAGIAILLGLIAPIILAVQGWDDHDRSNRTPARSLAWNYLQSCSPNAILYTNGDNDTFPLWYLQEVEEIRTDVRVANLSLMQTDWYTEQMMMRAYESDPLPIKFREDQILMGAGNTDYVMFIDYDVYSSQIDPAVAEKIMKAKIEHNYATFKRSLRYFRKGLASAMSMMNAEDAAIQEVLQKAIAELNTELEEPGYEEYLRTDRIMRNIFSGINSGKISGSNDLLNQLQEAATSWTLEWDYLPIDMAMEFVRNDANMLDNSGRKFRFFPSKGFIVPVNKDNAVAAKIITEEQKEQCEDEIRISFARGRMFRSDVRGLTREEVMMLDILANFDWKRGIYFSSPGGSDFARALYGADYLQNRGQVFAFSPLKRNFSSEDAKEKLYTNLMEVYDYGNLGEDGVLVDYYVRRHTKQQRSGFAELAAMYVQDYMAVKSQLGLEQKGMSDSLLVQNLEETLSTENDESQVYADKVEQIIRKSLTVLPMDRVLDMGEPQPSGRRLESGRQVYTDGTLPEHIGALYAVNKTQFADEVATEYLDQLEMMMNYFFYSEARIAYKNQDDFIALCMNFFRVYRDVSMKSANNELISRVQVMENLLSESVVPSIVGELQNMTTEEIKNGKIMSRKMDREAEEFLGLYKSLLIENGLMEE